jgi:hypothetical protein
MAPSASQGRHPGQLSNHLHFQWYATFGALLWREEVETLKAYDPTPAVFDEHNVALRFFANTLLDRIVKPYA